MNKNIFCVLAYLLFLSSSGQENADSKNDYIVIGDTAQRVGTIKYNQGDKFLEFKATYQDSYTQYQIESVSEFRLKKELYLRKQFNGEDLFFKVIEEGNFSIYATGDSYIANDGKQMLLISEGNFQKQLDEIFDGKCNWEYNRSQSVFQEAFLKHLFSNYNKKECFYVQKRSTSLVIAYGQPQMKIQLEDEGINRSLSGSGVISLGVSREVALFNWTSVLFSVHMITEKGEVEMDPLTNQSIGGIKIDNQSFLGTVQFRYYLNRFYVNGGIGVNFTNNNSKILRAKQSGDLEPDEFEFDKYGLAIIGGIGYRIYHSEKVQLSIEAQTQLWTRSNLRSKMSSIGVRIEI